MLENAAEIWKWIDGEGAHSSFAATRAAWRKMSMPRCARSCRNRAARTWTHANEYVEKLKSDKRYKRDVY